jgi:hypothetical protein
MFRLCVSPPFMSRILALLITGFWVTMWTLLLQTELEPQRAALREVPIAHVLKLFFHHQQASDLYLNSGGTRIGHVRFHPHIRQEDGVRYFEFSGHAQLLVPGAPRQRLSWSGEGELLPTMELSKLRLMSAVRESTTKDVPETTVIVHLDLVNRWAFYEIKSGDVSIDTQRFTMDEAGLRKLLDRVGIDPVVLQTVSAQAKGTAPRLFAHRSSMRLHDEKVDTLQVTAEMNGQTLLELHVSQLGQILHAKTITGWTLEAE